MSRPTTTQVLAAYLLAVLIAIFLSLAVIHWMASCWEAGPEAMCMLLAPALPVRGLRGLWRRLCLWRADLRMRETERQIAQYKRLLLDDSVHLGKLRDSLAAQQRAQLQRLSRP